MNDPSDAIAETIADTIADFIDPAARDRVTVEGPDAMSYLQSQISQEIRDQQVGEARWTLVLAPTGKIDTLARITRTADDTFVLDTDAGFGERLAARLNRFRIRVDAEVSTESAASDEPSAEHEAARVAAGWPRMGREIVPEETIPAVTGVVPLSVNFTKGCYPGQELVERMDARGADAPRNLRILAGGADVAEGVLVGSPILDADGNEVGTVTSTAGDRALGYVKRGAEVGRAPLRLERGPDQPSV